MDHLSNYLVNLMRPTYHMSQLSPESTYVVQNGSLVTLPSQSNVTQFHTSQLSPEPTLSKMVHLSNALSQSHTAHLPNVLSQSNITHTPKFNIVFVCKMNKGAQSKFCLLQETHSVSTWSPFYRARQSLSHKMHPPGRLFVAIVLRGK
jgi:hypothetical protein